MELAGLLKIRSGITAVIGGGGKTTLLRTLGRNWRQGGNCVLLCTTTKIFPLSGLPCACAAAELEQLRQEHRLLWPGTPVPDTRPRTSWSRRFDYVLVEADGAAHHPLKAHAPHEPVVPPGANHHLCGGRLRIWTADCPGGPPVGAVLGPRRSGEDSGSHSPDGGGGFAGRESSEQACMSIRWRHWALRTPDAGRHS